MRHYPRARDAPSVGFTGEVLGDTVTWRARHFGIVFRMTSAITEYDYPTRFVDEQQRGPFRRWWHEHTFTAMPGGRTQMIDVVEFQSPLGSAGSMADGLVPRHYMPGCCTSAIPGSKRPWKHAANCALDRR
jgi:hypothetical protein